MSSEVATDARRRSSTSPSSAAISAPSWSSMSGTAGSVDDIALLVHLGWEQLLPTRTGYDHGRRGLRDHCACLCRRTVSSTRVYLSGATPGPDRRSLSSWGLQRLHSSTHIRPWPRSAPHRPSPRHTGMLGGAAPSNG